MTRFAWLDAIAGGLAACAAFSVVVMLACVAGTDLEAYTTALGNCVAMAKTRAESEACRAGVKRDFEARWCKEYPDAGAWDCAALDGGAP